MSTTPDFAAYCEQACRKLWGEPTSEKPQTLKWRLDDYTWRAFDRQKHCWYDDESKRGGSTLELAALALGLPADSKIEGKVFLRCWDHATQWGVPAREQQKAKAEGNGGSGAWKFISEHLYRTASGEPFLRVRKYIDENGKKQYPQSTWDGKQSWVKGKPAGAKLPYRLPELIKSSPTTTIYFCEGEKDCDALAKIGVVATTVSEGAAAPWDDALTPYFKDRHVVIMPDADKAGRQHAQKVAKAINAGAQSVRVLDLYPDRNDGSDVSNWLETDTAGVKLTQLVKQAPLWEPSPADGKGDDASASDDDTLIAELAALPRLQYERRREEVAEKLGVRVSVLDKLVAAARKGEDEDKQDSSPVLYAHWNVEPSDEPVDGDVLLRAITETLRRHVIITNDQALVVALWVMLTWVHEQIAVHSPVLLVTSPLPNSGKTTLLKLISFLVRNGLSSVSITGAALFRSIAKWAPTISIDEADTAFVNNDDLKDVVNSGWTRGDCIIRCDPDTHDPRPYSTFCPKAIGMIGRKLPPATLSRCLMIAMRRKRPSEHADDFEHIDSEHLARLRSQLLRWAIDNVEELAKAAPEIPPGLHNRARMNWRTLLVLAEAAGGGWKRAAWKAVRVIEEVSAAADPERGVQLLSDIRDAFDRRGTDRMMTKTLLEELTADTEGPWAAYGKKGKPLTDRQLSGLLKDFRLGHGIKSRNIRVEGIDGPGKGYLRTDFEDDFASYLFDAAAKTPSPAATPLQINVFNDLEQKMTATGGPGVAAENGLNPLETNNCSGVAARNDVLAATEDNAPHDRGDGGAEDPSKACAERMASGPAFGLVRCRIFGPEPDGTACEQCGGTDGVVYAIASTTALGDPSRSLHERCAPLWFRAASETCAHCAGAGGAIGGPGQMWTVAGRDVWLHAHCEGPYQDAHAGEPPPWSPDPPDQDAPPW